MGLREIIGPGPVAYWANTILGGRGAVGDATILSNPYHAPVGILWSALDKQFSPVLPQLLDS